MSVLQAEPDSLRHTKSAPRRLLTAELRLLLRDPLTLTFVFIFPVVTMLIIGGSFGTEPDEVFPVNPAHWYVASYFTVVIGAAGLIMLPVHIASYRERGVLRRFAVADFPTWSFTLAQFVIGLLAIAVGAITMLLVAWPVYGIPEVNDPLLTAVGVVFGAIAFVGLGIILGSLLPTARAAQAIGLVLFFPSFLLGVGGPPPEVMSDALRNISEWLPLAIINNAIREPWLGIGDGHLPTYLTIAFAVVVVVIAFRRTSLR